MFTKEVTTSFEEADGINLLTSTPNYSQGNIQEEASNKVIIGIIEKIINDNKKIWHEMLSEALWVYQNSNREATSISPCSLTYRHDAATHIENSGTIPQNSKIE